MLAGTTDGVYMTAGPAMAWTPHGLSSMSVFDLAIIGTRWFATTSAGVFTSTDAGVTWTELPGLGKRRPLHMMVDDAARLVVGTDGYGAYRTPLP